jgi:hypothetical protein
VWSIETTLSALVPTYSKSLKPLYVISREAITGGVGVPLNFNFQSGCITPASTLSTEICGSVLIEEVRCASPPIVIQSPPPRPNWA